MPRVLIAGKLHPSGLAILRNAQGLDLDYVEDTQTEAMVPFLGDAQAILLRGQPMTASMIADSPNLKLISRHGVGYDAVDVSACNARGIALSIVGDVNAQSVAEHAMLLLLAASHRLSAYDAGTRVGGDWNMRNSLQAREISGKTLLIIGLGRIGRRLAKMASGFDMKVVAFDPYASDPPADIQMVDDLHTALPNVDLVSLHIPRADKPVLGAAELALLPAHAVVVNTARGNMIEETPLAHALNQGRLHGAGIDVFDVEPPDPGNPVLRAQGTVLTPHAASMTLECAERMATVAAQNIVDFFAGRLNRALVVNAAHISLA